MKSSDRTCARDGCENSLDGMRADARFCSSVCRSHGRPPQPCKSVQGTPYVGLSFVGQLQRAWARKSAQHAAGQ